MSDPDIARIRGITGKQISLFDYARDKYIPEPNELTPEQKQIIDGNMQGSATASVDAAISAAIGELARSASKKITVQRARQIDLAILNSDDNFIFLGSPISDPWSSMFNSLLDFQFALEPDFRFEQVRDLRPRDHERSWYGLIPDGQAPGEEYAVVAFVQNPGHNGQVLLLAGESGQGTKSVGNLVTDLTCLSAKLCKCGIDPQGSLSHFELLLRATNVAGSLTNSEVAACRVLNCVQYTMNKSIGSLVRSKWWV